MNVKIIVNPVFDGWSPLDIRLGGTEESVVEWATRLKRYGHNVSVFHNGNHLVHEGVPYRDRADYPGVVEAEPGITLNCNYPDLPTYERTVYFNNLVDARKYDLRKFAAIIHPSNYALTTVGISHDQQFIVPHGYDPAEIYPDEKIPHTVLYASSPDRGLGELERVWGEVVREVPDAQLLVTYNGQIDTPNTLCLGSVDADTMADLYRTSDIWCHPCLGGELFGITAVKAQVAGCWPVYYPTMALSETVKFGTATNPSQLAESLVMALSGHPDASEEASKHHYSDWDDSTEQLENVLKKWYN